MSKFLILSVDDEEITQGLIKEVLSTEHDVSLVASGEECLRFLEQHTPDLILLDVSMPPGMNGFETCKKLKQDQKLHNIPVIFVSGQSSEKERLRGYESGGVDYILKPFEIENLRDKINLNLELARQNDDKHKLERRLSDSNRSAIHALNYSNDLILVIQFYEHCQKFTTAEIIARKTLSITSALGLRAVIQIRENETSKEFSDFGIVTPLERQVIYENFSLGMFHKMHGYLMVNHSNISILIKNMPDTSDLEQEITYEKLQETLRALNYAANGCVIKLEQRNNISSVIDTAPESDIVDVMIQTLQDNCESYQSGALEVLKDILDLLDHLKHKTPSEIIQLELSNIMKTTLAGSMKIKDKNLDINKIKSDIENLLNKIKH